MNTQQGYVLIVEDVPDILKLLEATLTFKGYRVVSSVNGQEALEAIQRERPALVITDIMMPRLDGFGLVHRMRINPETREIPVIFLSSLEEGDTRGKELGAVAYLRKPVMRDRLLATVAKHVPGGVTPIG